jgi:putative peptidoglycan lipid II flippase
MESSRESQELESTRKELSKSTLGAMAGVVLSRLSGVIRQQVLSFVFGAGIATDAFYIAARYPNGLRDLLADGALSSAFTKSLVDAKKSGPEAERRLIAVVTAFFGIVTFFLALVGFVYAEPFMALTTSDAFQQNPGSLALATNLFRIMVFYLPIVMFTASAMAVLGVYRQTFRATFASSFFNLGNIFGALALAPLFYALNENPIYGLAVGAILGGVFQLVFSLRPLRNLNLLVWPRIAFSDLTHYKPLKDVLFIMTPRAIAQGAMILALFVNTLLASGGSGTITYISAASTIILVPVGLFGVASGFSSLPVLTEAATESGGKRFSVLLGQSAAGAMWLAFFSVVSFALLAGPFCALLFAHGRFTEHDAAATAAAVCAYSIGVVFNSTSKVLHQGFFALGKTQQVVANSLVYLAVNATLSYVFSRLDSGPVPFGLSNSIAAMCDFALNIYFLNRICKSQNISFFEHASASGFSLRRIVLTSALTFPIAIFGIVIVWQWKRFSSSFEHIPPFFFHLIFLCVGGFAVGLLFLLVSKRKAPEAIRESLRASLDKIERRLPQRLEKFFRLWR